MKKVMMAAGLLAATAGVDAFGAMWTNTGTGSWNTPSNWKEGVVPASNAWVTNDVGTILVSDGVTAAATKFAMGTASGKTGHLQITGGSLTLPSSDERVGAAAGGYGTVEMTGGEFYVGQLQVGAYGTGTMTLSGGIVYSKDWSCIGRYPGGVGTLTITGSGVWECQRNSLFASEQGTGTIIIENGGELRFASTNVREIVIGNNAAGEGTLRVNTGGMLKVAGVAARNAKDIFILDGGTLVRMSSGDNAGFIRTIDGGGKFQVGPNGGTIDTSTGTQTVALDIDDLPGSSGGPLVKIGTGTLVLSKGGMFTGGFTVEEGTLSVAASGNLPNWQTAPVVVKSGATLALGSGWTAADAAAFQARITVEDGGTVTYAGESTGDYVLNVAGTMTLSSPLNLPTRRLVKTGSGTLELSDGNVFGGGVVVSNGTLAADYAASGLADTHVHLAGTGTGSYCFLGIHGDSFTAPIASSGAGMFSFGPYTGFKVMESGPFMLNVGGDGNLIAWPQNGDWVFYPNDGTFTVKNPLDVNGKSNFTLKNNGSGDLVLEGGITNSSTSSAGVLNYWYGTVVIPPRAGGARHESYRFFWRAGDVLATNATIHSRDDFIVGSSDANSGLARVTLKDCVKTSGGGWDYVNGSTGTVLTVDGGRFAANGRLNIGYSYAGKTGRLVITNNAAVTAGEFVMHSGWADMCSGSLTVSGLSYFGNDDIAKAGRGPATFTQRGGIVTLNGGDVRIANATGSVGRVVMTGGSLFFKDGVNFQVGARGNGTLIQTGGDISAASYPCVGRYPGGRGEYLLHGGTFTHRIPADNKYLFFLSQEGTGTVSIANGGRMIVTNSNGIQISQTAVSKGTLMLSPGGTFEATQAYGSNGDDTFVFNGGKFKMFSNARKDTIIAPTVGHRVVTPLGGEIDTAGNGDFTLPVALTAASRQEELSETLIHRWRFDDGSLADSVGNSDATVGGTVAWTNGAVRLLGTACGTSAINLGANVLPTGGRGATIEMWVTQIERRKWARFICAGPSSSFWLTSNRGGETSTEMTLVDSGFSDIRFNHKFENGTMYHLAIVIDQQPDDTWKETIYISDAVTGMLLASGSAKATNWSFARIAQSGGIWLGRSHATADPDPYADYHDVRIYNRAMTAEQLAASCAAGPDAHFYLKKTGAGMLTMTGANTYKAGTAVDGGTLTLASGATIPATEMWAGAGATFLLNSTAQTVRELGGTGTVKGGTLSVTGTIQPGGRHQIGTLTVDGTSLTSGTLVADLAADGTSDCLAATGTLDLSHLSLALGDANLNTEKVYTLATAVEMTGVFADEELPPRWRTFVQPTKVTLAYANGTVMLFR